MITLFHGSYVPVPTPLVKLGRKKVDFGQSYDLEWLEYVVEWKIDHERYCTLAQTDPNHHVAG